MQIEVSEVVLGLDFVTIACRNEKGKGAGRGIEEYLVPAFSVVVVIVLFVAQVNVGRKFALQPALMFFRRLL